MVLNDVLTKNIYKTFFKYVSLNIMSMLAFSLYILADTFFIANAVGADGLVALNLVLPIFSILNGTGLMLGIGGATVYAIAKGAGDEQRARRIFTQIFALGAILGIIITVICVSLPTQIPKLLGANEEVIELASQYFVSLMAFSLFFILNHILMAFVKNDGAPKLAMTAMLSSSLFNIVFDYVLMYPCKLGMIGASLATGISPILSLAILSIHFFRKKNTFKLVKTKFFLSDIKKSLAAGTSNLITELSSGTIILVFNMVILKTAGNIGVGAYSVVANFALVGTSIFNGLGQGIQPIVSANFGAGNLHRTRKVLLLTFITALSLGGLYYLTCFLLRYEIIGLFNRDNIAELTALAANGITIYNVAFFFMGITMSGSYFLASVSKPQGATLASLLRGFLLPLPLVLLLPMAMNINGVWASVPIAEVLAAAFTLILTIYTVRNHKIKL